MIIATYCYILPLTRATLSPPTLCTDHDNCYNSDPDNHDCGNHHRDQNRCDHHPDQGKHLHLHHVTAAETVHNSGRNWPKIIVIVLKETNDSYQQHVDFQALSLPEQY